MKFVSSSGTLDSFELAILGYSQATKTWRDRNRLQCRFSTSWRQKADTQSALLQTWEVKRLLSGLRSLWDKATNHVTLTFSEPGLSVEAKALPSTNLIEPICQRLGHTLKDRVEVVEGPLYGPYNTLLQYA